MSAITCASFSSTPRQRLEDAFCPVSQSTGQSALTGNSLLLRRQAHESAQRDEYKSARRRARSVAINRWRRWHSSFSSPRLLALSPFLLVVVQLAVICCLSSSEQRVAATAAAALGAQAAHKEVPQRDKFVGENDVAAQEFTNLNERERVFSSDYRKLQIASPERRRMEMHDDDDDKTVAKSSTMDNSERSGAQLTRSPELESGGGGGGASSREVSMPLRGGGGGSEAKEDAGFEESTLTGAPNINKHQAEAATAAANSVILLTVDAREQQMDAAEHTRLLEDLLKQQEKESEQSLPGAKQRRRRRETSGGHEDDNDGRIAQARQILEQARAGLLDVRVAQAQHQVLAGGRAQSRARTRRSASQPQQPQAQLQGQPATGTGIGTDRTSKVQQQASAGNSDRNRTSVVIKAFNYKLRLDLELNDVLFGPNLVQKHFIPKGTHISAHQLDNCYYHAKSSTAAVEDDSSSSPAAAQPAAIGAFRTCNGLSGIIHVNNESLVIHPFYSSDLSKKQPHIIYRYQTASRIVANGQFSGSSLQQGDNDMASGGGSTTIGECANSRAPNEWTLRQFTKPASSLLVAANADERFARDTSDSSSSSGSSIEGSSASTASLLVQRSLSKRDVGLVEKYIELGLVLSKDMFLKRNASSRLEVLHDAIQIINCLDLYFRRSANTRVGIVYIETWAHGDQIELSDDPKQTLYNFLDYSTRHLYGTSKDAVHLITGGLSQQFAGNSFGMSIPDSVCTTKAVSVSQESSILEPFITAATIAHLIGHNLGMEHDEPPAMSPASAPSEAGVATSGVSVGGATAAAQRAPLTPSPQTPSSFGPNHGWTLTAQTPESGRASLIGGPASSTLSRGPALHSRGGARHNSQAHHQNSGGSSDGLAAEDHEDEIKSRSLTLEQALPARGGVAAAAAAGGGDSQKLDAASAWYEQLDSGGLRDSGANSAESTGAQECQGTCIMSERFVFLHPPIALGNMITQQVSATPALVGSNKQTTTTTTSATSQHNQQVNTYSIQETTILGGNAALAASNTTSAVGVGESANDNTGSSDEFDLSPLRDQQQQQQQQQVQVQQGDGQAGAMLAAASLPFRFSRRSIDTYYMLLREGRAFCLWNKPNKIESSIAATCGNGIVERDEDCDCGSRPDCWSDTCCERLTCKFRKGVECISGACCDRCRFRPRGFMCRRARGECDLAEFCDGKSFSCGPDVHKQNGFPCGGGGGGATNLSSLSSSSSSAAVGSSGYCFMGQCPTHDGQCGELWGAHARASDKLCYAQLNTNGTIFGNCGRLESTVAGSSSQRGVLGGSGASSSMRHLVTGSGGGGGGSGSNSANHLHFKRCAPESQMCGSLQCQLGDMKPITAELDAVESRHSPLATSYEFSRKILRQAGRDFECKMITKPIGHSGQHSGNQQQQQQQHRAHSVQTSTTAGGAGASSSLSSISYVRDGTKCDEGRVCFNQTCQPLERAYPDAFELCPRDERGQFCSQHGICSTANRCHCDAGWTGEDCSQSWPLQPPQLSAANEAQAGQPQLTNTLIEISAGGSGGGGGMSNQQMSALSSTVVANPKQADHHVVQQQQQQRQQQLETLLGPQVAMNDSDQPTTTTTQASMVTSTEAAKATTTAAATAPAAPSQAQAQGQTTTTTNVQDKKKHDSLGAQTLVLILVSIVAAVYLGFALMANCYRRKGLLKPDKVLRHHQMNCKMDALRSSFIAKRLADADTLTFDPSASTGNLTGGPWAAAAAAPPVQPPMLSHNASAASADLINAFVTPLPVPISQQQQQQQQQQFVQQPNQEFLQQQQQYEPDDNGRMAIQMTANSILHAPKGRQSAHKGSVRYFEQHPGHATAEMLGSGDHIPLLSADSSTAAAAAAAARKVHQQHAATAPLPPPPLPPPVMRSSAFNQQTLADRRRAQQARRQPYQVRAGDAHNQQEHEQQVQMHPQQQQQQQQRQLHSTWTMRSSGLIDASEQERRGSRTQPKVPLGSFMNRTRSLGSVHRQQQQQQQQAQAQADATLMDKRDRDGNANDNDDDDDADEASSLMERASDELRLSHGALVTPSRSSRDRRASARSRASSIGYHWNQHARGHHQHHSHHLHRSRDRLAGRAPSRTPGDFDSCSAPSSPEHRFTNAEPAAYWTSGAQHADGGWYDNRDKIGDAGGAPAMMSTFGRPSRPRYSLRQRQRSADHQERYQDQMQPLNDLTDQTPSSASPPPPLPPLLPFLPRSVVHNKTPMHDLDETALMSRAPMEPALHEHHLSLISQLQQLERVQSLHQKQVAATAATNNGAAGGSLHDFFSLPLSVQLSALLARSLAESSGQQSAPATSHIDDYLNILNNTGVAASSRRNFKSARPSVVNDTKSPVATSQQQQLQQQSIVAAAATALEQAEQAQQQQQQSRDQQQQHLQSGNSSRGGTLRKQQNVKLQNLQSLISRLQKLHNQTLMQQFGDDDEQLDSTNTELEVEGRANSPESGEADELQMASIVDPPRGSSNSTDEPPEQQQQVMGQGQ